MNTKDKLEVIQKIRSFRVRKKQKKVKMIESAIAENKNQISKVDQTLVEGRTQFQKEKKDKLDRLMNSKAGVDALFDIRKKELLHEKFVVDNYKEKDQLIELGEKKTQELQVSLKDLWVSEKALMKIEEFIKLDIQ